MNALFETIIALLWDHWLEIATAAVSAAIGWFLGHRRARSQWKKREFLDRLNVSLTYIQDGTLKIRTLLEKPCVEVFLNKVAVESVLQASRKTTEADPLLVLPKEDYWFYLNAVLNEVAEKFAEGQLRQELGLPVQCAMYLLALTSEAAGPVRTRKVRGMLVRKSLLENLPSAPPKFDQEHHSVRWTTLQQMQASYRAAPERFIVVELCGAG